MDSRKEHTPGEGEEPQQRAPGRGTGPPGEPPARRDVSARPVFPPGPDVVLSVELWPVLCKAGRWLATHLVRYNPAYILSAALMIAGVYTILEPGEQALGNLPAILATFSTFQVYELLLVGIALFLIRRLGVMDDGATLVLVEAAFVVGSFIILDEVTFRDGHVALGLGLGLLAAALAVCRFGVLAPLRAFERGLRRPLLGLMVLLFVWNAVAPAVAARVLDAGDPGIEALHLAGWWALAALALPMAVLAGSRRQELLPEGRAFVQSPVGFWVMAGIVVLVSAVHQNRIGYVLDIGFSPSDAIPLATVVCVGLVNALTVARRRRRGLEHVVAALPAGLCVVVLLGGWFEPLGAWGTRVAAPRAVFVHELRTLTWPTAWLGLVAALTLLHAWRRRSAAFAHQAGAVAMAAAWFAAAATPHPVATSPTAFVAVLGIYLLINAIAYRSPHCAIGFLVILNAGIRCVLPSEPVWGVYVSPNVVWIATLGVSAFGFWVAFRRWAPRWVPHLGTALVMLAVVSASFARSTQAPRWLLGAGTVGLAAALALVARLFGWWFYYGLSVVALCIVPGRLLARLEQTGWLLVFASFVALGLGLLISTRKARLPGPSPPVPGPAAEPP